MRVSLHSPWSSDYFSRQSDRRPEPYRKRSVEPLSAIPADHYQAMTQVRFGGSNAGEDSSQESDGVDGIIEEMKSARKEPFRPMSDHEKLIAAVQSGKTEEAQRLLVQIPDINAYGQMGETALAAAAKLGSLPLVNTLLSRPDIDVNLLTLQDEDQEGPSKTPLMLAIQQGHTDVALRLLDHPQVNLEIRDEALRTALMLAAIQGNVKVLEKILARGGDLQQRDGESRNAIGLASICGQAEAVRFLLSKGADANHAGYDGRNALALAQRYGHQAVVNILMQANQASQS